MTTPPTSDFHQLKSGVPGLDDVLGGGLPSDAFTLICGGPGTGKTTLVQQMLFQLATPERPALFFTVLGEPRSKLLRHQRQFSFFSDERVGTDVHLVCLSDLVGYGFDAYLKEIAAHIERVQPAFVAVDSFRAVLRSSEDPYPVDLERFVQGLALLLTSSGVTSFLVGEYGTSAQTNPVFTVADVILSLDQAVDRNSVVRKFRVVKSRGQAGMPGLHTFRITDDGLQILPRIPVAPGDRTQRVVERLSTGIPKLDGLMGGGLPREDVLLVSGPTGSGKTTFGLQFALDGVGRGETVVVAAFEERPREYLARARVLGGPRFDGELAEGRFVVLTLRPLDLSVDETLFELQQTVQHTGATRVVIDSVSGFEVALAPTLRLDFRESLHRLLEVLRSLGVTVLLTNEANDDNPEQCPARFGVSSICDDILQTRYVEIEGEFRRVLTVLKMRTTHHSPAIHSYETTTGGIAVGPPMTRYEGLMGSAPRRSPSGTVDFHGLTATEARLGHAVRESGSATRTRLAEDTGLDAAELDAALDRLVHLGYAVRLATDDGATYASLARPLP